MYHETKQKEYSNLQDAFVERLNENSNKKLTPEQIKKIKEELAIFEKP